MGKASVAETLSKREAQYKQQANVAFQLLVLSQKQSEKFDMRELFSQKQSEKFDMRELFSQKQSEKVERTDEMA